MTRIVFSKEEVDIIQKYMDTESPENISDNIRKELGVERCSSSIRTKIKNLRNTNKTNTAATRSWEGYEHIKKILVKASLKYKCSSIALKNICGGEELIHNTLAAMNGNTYKIKSDVLEPSIKVAHNLKRLNHLSAHITRKYNISPILIEQTKDDLL
ncbi:hypothetical protein ACTFIW_012764 [Dictyostelium discoideum]